MAAKTAKTRYVALTRPADEAMWQQLPGEYEGHSTEDALKAAQEKVGGAETDAWVAIPVSYWRVAKVVTETNPKTTVIFEKPARRRRTVEAAPA